MNKHLHYCTDRVAKSNDQEVASITNANEAHVIERPQGPGRKLATFSSTSWRASPEPALSSSDSSAPSEEPTTNGSSLVIPEPVLSSNGSSAPSEAASTAQESSSGTTTNAYEDALSPANTALSIQRSFDILSKMNLCAPYERRRDVVRPDYFCGEGSYAKELTEDEKQSLIDFANEYIIGGSSKNRRTS